jgi:hypothetical protein
MYIFNIKGRMTVQRGASDSMYRLGYGNKRMLTASQKNALQSWRSSCNDGIEENHKDTQETKMKR